MWYFIIGLIGLVGGFALGMMHENFYIKRMGWNHDDTEYLKEIERKAEKRMDLPTVTKKGE